MRAPTSPAKRVKCAAVAVPPRRPARSPRSSSADRRRPSRVPGMANRPFYVSLGWILRDYSKRVWDNSGEDNVLFLAGGIAFNIILAAVPFVLLVVWLVTYFFGAFNPDLSSTSTVIRAIDLLLPSHEESPSSPIHKLLTDLFK